MAHCNTVFAQILKLFPRHEFETLAVEHHAGRSFRRASRWSQFVTMVTGQLTGRNGLRDLVTSTATQAHRLYHLGSRPLSRSNLSRINEDKPYTLYEALFGKLLARCQQKTPGHDFRFHNRLYSLDATTIDLCLSVFPWAEFRTTKGAIKLHTALSHEGYLPEFLTVTEGKTHDVTVAKTLSFPKGSIVAIDKGYTDYSWYRQLSQKGVFFVTRLKTNARYRVVERREVQKKQGIRSDQTIVLTGVQSKKRCPLPLRRIGFKDPETGKEYVFLTNHFKLAARTIANIYKARWQVELFFKWIKQNLKIKAFVGNSKNAVLTQIWIAMCVYLMLSLLKFQSKIGLSLQQMARILQVNLFEKRDLLPLLRGDPPNQIKTDVRQLVLL